MWKLLTVAMFAPVALGAQQIKLDSLRTPADTLLAYMNCYAGEMMNVIPRWNITVFFQEPEDSVAVAEISVIPEYLSAAVTIDLKKFAKKRDRERRQIVVHELHHVLVWRLVRHLARYDINAAIYLAEEHVSEVAHMPIWYMVCQF